MLSELGDEGGVIGAARLISELRLRPLSGPRCATRVVHWPGTVELCPVTFKSFALSLISIAWNACICRRLPPTLCLDPNKGVTAVTGAGPGRERRCGMQRATSASSLRRLRDQGPRSRARLADRARAHPVRGLRAGRRARGARPGPRRRRRARRRRPPRHQRRARRPRASAASAPRSTSTTSPPSRSTWRRRRRRAPARRWTPTGSPVDEVLDRLAELVGRTDDDVRAAGADDRRPRRRRRRSARPDPRRPHRRPQPRLARRARRCRAPRPARRGVPGARRQRGQPRRDRPRPSRATPPARTSW